MKSLKMMVMALSMALVAASCNMSNAAKGGMIGGAAGGAVGAGLGAGIGALVSGSSGAKLGAAIGAGVGVAGGATAGALIGRKMDKAKAAAAAIANAETYTDKNGLEGVKVTFDGGILFATGKSQLSSKAQTSLKKFAEVLKEYNDCDVNIYGFASSVGSEQTNLTLSQARATSVSTFLKNCGVASTQLKATTGFGENPEYLIYNADGSENQAASQRVEVYLYASEAMIKAANEGTLQ